MTKDFNIFIKKNESRIAAISNQLQYFTIEAKTIGIREAKRRVTQWLENFDKIGFKDFNLPLELVEKLEFIKCDDISDKVIKLATLLTSDSTSYISSLGETNESSFKITAKLHQNPNYHSSLVSLLNTLPNTGQNKILLFDDFLNTGGQIISIFYSLLDKPLPKGAITDEIENRTKLNKEQIRKLTESEIHLFFYQAFDEGIKKVYENVKDGLNLNIFIKSHHQTNMSGGAFGDKDEQEKIEERAEGSLIHKSIFQGKKYSEINPFYVALKTVGKNLLEQNERGWNRVKIDDRLLGYGNLCRVILTDSNIPTVSITALWQSGKIKYERKKIEWQALLPRTKKVLSKRGSGISLAENDSNTKAKNKQNVVKDYGSAWINSKFIGRNDEKQKIISYIVDKNVKGKTIGITGFAGKGKTSLTLNIAQQVEKKFNFVFWRSVKNLTSIDSILIDLFKLLTNNTKDYEFLDIKTITKEIIEFLKAKKILLILDNFESILNYKNKNEIDTKYIAIVPLLKFLSDEPHNCTLIFTSQTLPSIFDKNSPKFLHHEIRGVEVNELKEILEGENIEGGDIAWDRLNKLYSGNIGLLKLVSNDITNVHSGSIKSYLKNTTHTKEYNNILSNTLSRLNTQEELLLYWLAIQPIIQSLNNLSKAYFLPFDKDNIADTLINLKANDLIKIKNKNLFIDSFVSDYVVKDFVESILSEIKDCLPDRLIKFPLINYLNNEYYRKSQKHSLLNVISFKLQEEFSQLEICNKFKYLINQQRGKSKPETGYLISNIIYLIDYLDLDFRNFDFSEQFISPTFFDEMYFKHTSLENSKLNSSVFADNFGSITAIAFDSNNNSIIAGTFNGLICIWDFKSYSIKNKFSAHSDWVSWIQVISDKTFATSSGDGFIKIWEANENTFIKIYESPDHKSKIRNFTFDGKKQIIYSACENGKIGKIETNNGNKFSITSSHHKTRIKSIEYNSKRKKLITAGDDGIINVWEPENNAASEVLKIHKASIRTIKLSNNQNYFAAADDLGFVSIWNTSTLKCLKLFQAEDCKIWSLVFTVDDSFLLTGSNHGVIKVWNWKKEQIEKRLDSHGSWVRTLAITNNPNLIISGSEDQTIKIWDISSSTCVATFRGYNKKFFSMEYLGNNKLLAGYRDRSIDLWDIETGEILKTYHGHEDKVWCLKKLNDFEFVSASDDKQIKYWKIQSGECFINIKGHKSWIGDLAISEKHKFLISGGDDNYIMFWDLETGSNTKSIISHEGRISSIAISEKQDLLITASEDKLIKLWHLPEFELINKLTYHNSLIYAVAIDETKNIIASGGNDKLIVVYDLTQKNILFKITTDSIIWSLSFISEKNLLIAGDDLGNLLLIDSGNGTIKRIIRCHDAQIWKINSNENQTQIFTCSEDATIKIWDLDSMKEIRKLQGENIYHNLNIKRLKGISNIQKKTLMDLGATLI